jgi:hypothetical protein
MQHVHFAKPFLCTLLCVIALPPTSSAAEPIRLLGTIVKWRYPESEIGESEMSDAATVDADGKRTVPSTLLKTTMVTPDSVDKVLAFYRGLLTRTQDNDRKLGIKPNVGRSVLFSDESAGRSFAFHTIVVNSEDSSTTLIITRGIQEESTHITWKQYLAHRIGE